MTELIDEKIKHVWGLCLTTVVTTTSTVNFNVILIVVTLCHKFMETKVIAQKPIVIGLCDQLYDIIKKIIIHCLKNERPGFTKMSTSACTVIN